MSLVDPRTPSGHEGLLSSFRPLSRTPPYSFSYSRSFARRGIRSERNSCVNDPPCHDPEFPSPFPFLFFPYLRAPSLLLLLFQYALSVLLGTSLYPFPSRAAHTLRDFSSSTLSLCRSRGAPTKLKYGSAKGTLPANGLP